MRCIFCKCDSSNSKSVEHIIPESLGNTLLTLRSGIVCDKCNNYFAREVEKPFLEHEGVRHLRFEEGVLSKKGRIPEVQGLLIDGNEIRALPIKRFPDVPLPVYTGSPLVFTVGEHVELSNTGRIIIPKFDASYSLPTGHTLSRFLGKIALEFMALRLSDHSDGIDYLVDHKQLDELREHVRLGKYANWPCSVRKIYEQNSTMLNKETGEEEQVVYEIDILVTENNEYFLVLALFGVEFVINIGGAEIEGYHIWLKGNNNQSLFYRQ